MLLTFRNLKGIFKHHLWKESSKDLHLTFIASSIDVGYRRPVIPTEKDGVVLQLGRNANFSEELLYSSKFCFSGEDTEEVQADQVVVPVFSRRSAHDCLRIQG